MASNPKIHNAEVIPEKNLPAVATVPSFNLVPLDELKDMCKAIDEAKREVMEAGRDYMTIPGTKKPSLLKPGGEKLMKLFNLSPRFFEVEVIEEHHRNYAYKKYGKDVEVKGWYFYRIRCELFNKNTGQSWGDGIGICSSNERPGQPANTISKMAQKSAMLAAVLLVCNASDLFTQDMDEPGVGHSSDNNPQSNAPVASGEIEKPMTSKYGTDDKPSKCNLCGNHHILKGDTIVCVNGKWGAEDCFRLKQGHDEAKANYDEANEDPDLNFDYGAR